jgi:hypothetical protein
LEDKGIYTLNFLLENEMGYSKEEEIKFELKTIKANYE